MTTPAADQPTAAFHLGQHNQAGDVSAGDVAGRDLYQGVPSEQIMTLLARFLDKEPQRAALEHAAREKRDERLDRQLDRIVDALDRSARSQSRTSTALIVEAVVLGLFLVVMLQVIVAQFGPHLIAGM